MMGRARREIISVDEHPARPGLAQLCKQLRRIPTDPSQKLLFQQVWIGTGLAYLLGSHGVRREASSSPFLTGRSRVFRGNERPLEGAGSEMSRFLCSRR